MTSPALSVHDVQQLAAAQLSRAARFGYVALLLVAAAMTTIVLSLWLTELYLPPRTQVAFVLMAGIGFSWIGFAAWVLAQRRPLIGVDRLIAARMAVAFCTLFAIGFATLGVSGQAGRFAYTAAAAGVAMLAGAVMTLHGARQRVRELTTRRLELEREIARRHA